MLQVTSMVIRWIMWIVEKNEAADALSRLRSQRKPVPPNVFLDVLHNPSVKLLGEADLAIPDWWQPCILYRIGQFLILRT